MNMKIRFNEIDFKNTERFACYTMRHSQLRNLVLLLQRE